MERMNANDAMDLEQECELWDWVRTAGVSAEALRVWLVNPPLPPIESGVASPVDRGADQKARKAA